MYSSIYSKPDSEPIQSNENCSPGAHTKNDIIDFFKCLER